jgi:hypothetical protein
MKLSLKSLIRNAPDDQASKIDDFDQMTTQCASLSNVEATDWSDQEFKDFSMQQALRGMDEDSAIYTDADLQKRWQ